MTTSTPSTGITTTSMFNTPQAKNDVGYVTEGGANISYFDVMLNDLGGSAKQLWAIVAGSESQVVVNNGDATVTAGEAMWSDLITSDIGSLATEYSERGATISIASGKIVYDTSSATMQSLLNSLAQGQVIEDHITYTIRLGNGTLSMATLTITLTGTNDAPVIGATSQVAGTVVEAGSLDNGTAVAGTPTASGTMVASDVDSGASQTWSTPAAGADSPYGSFAITAAGVWTYTLDNAAAGSLAEGASATESFTVTVTDEFGASATQTVTLTLTGTNDAPVIAVVGTDTASATIAETNAGLTKSGTLTVTDADTSDTINSAVTGVVASGPSGGLTNTALQAMLSVSPTPGLAADTGNANNLSWNFNSGSQALDFLNVGQSLVLTYTVTSTDPFGASDPQTVTITITGTADGVTIPAVVTGADPNDFDGGTASGTATSGADTLIGTSGSDTISAIGGNDQIYGRAGADSLLGGAGNDTIYGGSGNDTIDGGINNDFIFGGSGNDSITGNDNSDNIYGGYGADTLTGGANSDNFIFLSTNDTGDTIIDFGVGADDINLEAIDANISLADDQAFVFGGTTATANGVWYAVSGGNSTVYVDTNGNTSDAELVFYLTGVTSLGAGDFIL